MNEHYGARLVVVSGADARRELELDGRPVLIGRDPECDLALRDSYASRQHCWVEQREGRWWVRDLGSKNGTWVGDEQVVHERPLYDGDVVLVGHTRIRLCESGATETYDSVLAVQSRHRLWLDEAARAAIVDEAPVEPPLSPKQWALLRLLWERRGAVVTKDEIARAVWPEAEGAIFDYQIDKLVSRVRARLGPAGDELIETVWGTGYKLHC
ncbi:MAG: FHA domain-containing protein [Ardenticatenaceae bacterium]|nr:FHA domain-containing protein [Ardenticatenaceae bacterium]